MQVQVLSSALSRRSPTGMRRSTQNGNRVGSNPIACIKKIKKVLTNDFL